MLGGVARTTLNTLRAKNFPVAHRRDIPTLYSIQLSISLVSFSGLGYGPIASCNHVNESSQHLIQDLGKNPLHILRTPTSNEHAQRALQFTMLRLDASVVLHQASLKVAALCNLKQQASLCVMAGATILSPVRQCSYPLNLLSRLHCRKSELGLLWSHHDEDCYCTILTLSCSRDAGYSPGSMQACEGSRGEATLGSGLIRVCGERPWCWPMRLEKAWLRT